MLRLWFPIENWTREELFPESQWNHWLYFGWNGMVFNWKKRLLEVLKSHTNLPKLVAMVKGTFIAQIPDHYDQGRLPGSLFNFLEIGRLI